MSSCIENELGLLLHDYELGLLSADDKLRFELHLYECDYCLTQVREFAETSRIFKHDPTIREIVEALADDSDNVNRGSARNKSSLFTRLLIAAVIVLAVSAPIYLYWSQPEQSIARQTLELLPSRSGGSNIIYLDQGGEVTISFYADEELQASADIVIAEIEGDTLLIRQNFSDFNEHGLGTITLPLSTFFTGHYMLTIKPDSETELGERIYMFRVK